MVERDFRRDMRWDFNVERTLIMVGLVFIFCIGCAASGIYRHDLLAQQEFQITSDPSGQGVPAIYGDIVVWEDGRNGNEDIYGYNLSTQQEFQITSDPSGDMVPAIYGDIVVWWDDRNGNDDIYGYNLSAFDKNSKRLDQNSLAKIVFYISAFLFLVYMGYKLVTFTRGQRRS